MKDSKSRLEIAVAHFERDYTVVPGLASAYFATSTERVVYTTISSGGEKVEGVRLPALFATEEDAIDSWLKAARAFAEAQQGPYLYWRQKPSIERIPVVVGGVESEDYFTVYSRFAVTPVVWPVVERGVRTDYPQNGNIVVSDGERGFLITEAEIQDNLAPAMFAAGLQHLRRGRKAY